MPHTTFRVGRLTCHALEAGRQALDGGAMFGVVPKPLWQRRIPADERNRIPLALRCLLVEHDDGLVRSEEHTSELQSHSELVCRLLLEKKTADALSGLGTSSCGAPLVN